MYYAYILAEPCWLILASLSYKPSVVKHEDVETNWSAASVRRDLPGPSNAVVVVLLYLMFG